MDLFENTDLDAFLLAPAQSRSPRKRHERSGPTLRIDGQLWFNRGEKGYLGKRIDLLEQIEATGSISRAAKAIKLSYKAAWDAVDAMNNLSERPLVICSAGGAQGGGTRLTDFGREMLHVWRRMQAEYERFSPGSPRASKASTTSTGY